MAKKQSCLMILFKMALLFGILVGLIILGFIFLREKLNEYFNRGDTIEVPDFRGKSIAEVLDVKPSKLNIEKRDEKFDSRYPKGHVVAQFPEAGTRVKPEKKVFLTLSLGSRQMQVPDIQGRTLRETELALLNAQLIHGNRSFLPSSTIVRDRVIAQSPLPGSMQAIQEGVDMLISLGPRPARFPLPNISGQSLDEAKNNLTAWGLRTGRVLSRHDQSKPKFQVISTNPSPYESVAEGTLVDLMISAGSESGNAQSKDLKHFEFQDGVTTLPGSNKRSSSQTTTQVTPPRILISNDPVPITTVKPPPVETVTPKPEVTSRMKKISFSMPDGFMPKEVEFIHVTGEGRTRLYSGIHKPMDTVIVDVPPIAGSKVQIYINNVPIEERVISE